MRVNLASLLSDAKRCLESGLSALSPAVVYEAGCGSAAIYADLLTEKMLVLGVDADRSQLQRNRRNDLSVLADIQQFELAQESVDLVVCFDVLEHVAEPQRVLQRFDHCLKANGFLLIAMPNLWSLKGLITRLTPYQIHKLFYWLVIGDRSAMSDEGRQYHTYLKRSATPKHLLAHFKSLGYKVHIFQLYEGPVPETLRKRRAVFGWVFDLVYWLGAVLTLNRVDLRHSDAFMVFQKVDGHGA